MNRNAIAANIKHYRNARHWSQEELALASGLDVRTIQRAEAGRPLAVESLRAIAAAFDTTIELLQVSEEKIAEIIENFQKKHKVIEMRVIDRSSDLGELIGGSEAMFLHRIGDLTESQLDRIAEFQDYLRDYLDIWRDMEAVHKREAEKELHKMVQSLTQSDMSVSFGIENMPLRIGSGDPFRMSVLYIAITRGPVPMLAVARPKTMPISFA